MNKHINKQLYNIYMFMLTAYQHMTFCAVYTFCGCASTLCIYRYTVCFWSKIFGLKIFHQDLHLHHSNSTIEHRVDYLCKRFVCHTRSQSFLGYPHMNSSTILNLVSLLYFCLRTVSQIVETKAARDCSQFRYRAVVLHFILT